MTRTDKAAGANGRITPPRAQRYKDRAAYLRDMARKTPDADVRAELQRLAREFEARAARQRADGRAQESDAQP